jgi:hypothetical protein
MNLQRILDAYRTSCARLIHQLAACVCTAPPVVVSERRVRRNLHKKRRVHDDSIPLDHNNY